jgi:hypothetical protein
MLEAPNEESGSPVEDVVTALEQFLEAKGNPLRTAHMGITISLPQRELGTDEPGEEASLDQ